MASSVEKELYIQETSQGASNTSTLRVKPPPKPGIGKIPVPFSYLPSDDGTDENLLILVHGLGDTHVPFAKMGIKLPQTAVLALRAPEKIPFLYEESYQWYTSFDPLGELIPNPNPTPAIDLLSKVVNYLTIECGWPLNRIHLFGFAQGGSVVVEFGLSWWKEKQLPAARKALTSSSSGTATATAGMVPMTSFGSITTIAGPLLSYPSLSALSPTPLLVVSRPRPSELAFSSSDITGFKKGYQVVKEVKYENASGGMPVGKAEWEPVMRFWSERLERRIGGGDTGLYQVLSGFA